MLELEADLPLPTDADRHPTITLASTAHCILWCGSGLDFYSSLSL